MDIMSVLGSFEKAKETGLQAPILSAFFYQHNELGCQHVPGYDTSGGY